MKNILTPEHTVRISLASNVCCHCLFVIIKGIYVKKVCVDCFTPDIALLFNDIGLFSC